MSEERVCKNCIHYQMCVLTFRKGKQDGDYLLIEEDAYFSNADGCDFYADKRIYRRQTEGKWIVDGVYFKVMRCSACGKSANSIYEKTAYCPHCGAKMERENV